MAVKFRPVKGTEAEILSAENVAGYLYFTTDTGRIYLGNGGEANEKIAMGRNSGVYYGNKVINKNNDATQIEFELSDLEADLLPNLNDLILNEPNGGFYKVIELKETSCIAKPITIAGQNSGASIYYIEESAREETDGTYIISLENYDEEVTVGDILLTDTGSMYRITLLEDNNAICSVISSGNGGGGGGSSASSLLKLTIEGLSSNSTTILNTSRTIKLIFNSSEETITSATLSATGLNTYNNVTKNFSLGLGNIILRKGEPYELEMGNNFPLGTNKINFSLNSTYDGEEIQRTISVVNIRTTNMELKKSTNFNNLEVKQGSFPFACLPVGSTDIDMMLYIDIDGQRVPELTMEIPGRSQGKEVSPMIPALSHGVHEIVATLTAEHDTIQSSLKYQVACREEGNTAPIIWLDNIADEYVEFEKIILRVSAFDPARNGVDNKATIQRYLNGKMLPTVEQTWGDSKEWLLWSVLGTTLGKNEIILVCNSTQLVYNFTVVKGSRDMSIIKSNLILNLDSEGRSNSENVVERADWSSSYGGVESKVEFKDFNWYNNGWITDDDNNTCLRISNGAKINIPLKELKDSGSNDSPYTFEFVFKLRNVKKYSFLIDYDDETKRRILNKEDIRADEMKKITKSNEGVCIQYYENNSGFCIGTQEAYFKGENTIVNGKYKEDELIHLAFVLERKNDSITNPFMYIFINGLNSGVAQYAEGEKFNTGNLDHIEINSEFCDIDIYKIRVYRAALKAEEIVQNYVADYADSDLYDINNDIVTYENNIPNIDFNKMILYNENHKDAQLMPYAVIETTDLNNILPYKKQDEDEDAWKVNIEFVNPALDRAYELKLISDDEYLKGCPSYTSKNALLNVQGTSSQGYPRRNYKAKLKDADSWTYTTGPLEGKEIAEDQTLNGATYSKWYMDSPIGESSFTWKADYMESSGSHNGGLASFLQLCYTKHPLEDLKINVNGNRTTVYGFPMMVFHKASGGNGQGKYTFLGRYVYLLDKSCKDTFGFTNKSKSHVQIKLSQTNDIVADNRKTYYTIKNDVATAESRKAFKAGKIYYEEDNVNGTLYYLDLATVTECWQIEDNQGGRCSLKKSDIGEVVHDSQLNRDVLAITKDFSVRYHIDKDNIEYATARKKEFTSDEYSNNYLVNKYKNLGDLLTWVSSTDITAATNAPIDPVNYEGIEYTHDNAEYRLAKFRNEFELHFDLEYSLVYFIITELLLCYDSRGKNCMLATWGPMADGLPYKWYPIFYDMDTQLGINNSGVPYWDYYEEATNNGTFSTNDSVLWNNLWACFETQIKAKYAQLRKTDGIDFDTLNGYYDFNPDVSKVYSMRGGRPLIMKNIDEYYKYIDCARGNGYTDAEGNAEQHTYGYIYCLQGDRLLQRYMFLRNRLNYIDSQWLGGAYAVNSVKTNTQRIDSNDAVNTSDKFLPSSYVFTQNENETEEDFIKRKARYVILDNPDEEPLNAKWEFNITPYLKQYVSMYVDERATPIYKAEDGQTITISSPRAIENGKAPYNQQIIYFSGMSYISSLGDLSLAYPDKLDLASAKRIKDLVLGNDNEGYINLNLKSGMGAESSFSPDDALKINGKYNQNAKTLLEKVVLTGLGNLKGNLDFSGSEKMKEFRALGTNLTSVTFADGVQLEKLYLPNTVNIISLKEPTMLTGLVSNGKGTKIDGKFTFENGIYLDGVTNLTTITPETTTNVRELNIVGGNMGYTSYKLAKQLVDIKKSMLSHWDDNTFTVEQKNNLQQNIAINLENVKWSPYRLVEFGEPVIDDATYVKKTYGFTFEPYTPGDDWTIDTKNSKIYEVSKDNTDKSLITDLSLLDDFIKEINITNLVHENGKKSIPYISGDIFIDNIDSKPISETLLKNEYIDKYFKNLNIYVAKAAGDNRAIFLELDGDLEKEVDTVSSIGVQYVVPTELKPSTRPHWDWLGWSDTPNGEPITDWTKYEFSATKTEYTFYAVYAQHVYDIKFINGDGNEYLAKVVANTEIPDPTVSIPSNQTELLIPYKDDSELEMYDTYAFDGWSLNKPDAEIINFVEDKQIALDDATYYSHFKKVDVHSQPTNPNYFSINSQGQLYPKEKLKGKITIPTKLNGTTVKSISGFGVGNNNGVAWDTQYYTSNSKGAEVTGIYFMPDSMLERIEPQAFIHCYKLKYFEFPANLKTIGSLAFKNCYGLLSSDLSSSSKLDTIQAEAFNSCWLSYQNDVVVKLPASVATLGATSFYRTDDLNRYDYYAWLFSPNFNANNISNQLSQVIIGDAELRSKLTASGIGGEAFKSSDDNKDNAKGVQSITIYCQTAIQASDLDNKLKAYCEHLATPTKEG